MHRWLACTMLMTLVGIPYDAYTQKEDHQWIFNWTSADDLTDWPELGASVLDFNTLPPRAYRAEEITLDMGPTNASICDAQGALMYYSNGMAVHSGRHQPVIAGDTIAYVSGWHTLVWPNEHGEPRSAGHNYIQSVGFVPKPDDPDSVYVIYENYTSKWTTGYSDLQYGTLVVNADGDYELLDKDASINDKVQDSGNIHACRHANGRDWWMLQFSRDTVYTYLIDPRGIRLSHLQFLPFELRRGNGQSKFSSHGNYFALYHRFQNEHPTGMDLMVSEFDRCTGHLFNSTMEQNSSFNVGIDTGIEFSPDENLLYVAKPLEVFQYDLKAHNIFASRIRVALHDEDNSVDSLGCNTWFGQLQLAPDNKVYVGRAAQCFNIHVINFPNRRGEACDVQQSVIQLPTFAFGALPNFNTYRLGPLDGSGCDTLGLDNNPVSRYWYEQDSMDFLTTQFWDVSYYRPESWHWDFGDGSSSTARHPVHKYSSAGVYEVCLTVSNEHSSNTSCQTLQLGTVSTSESTLELDVSLFPNPTEGFIRITLHDSLPREGRILLYDLSAKLVLTEKIIGGANGIDLSLLPAGTYVYELVDGQRVLKTGKLVKQ